jgi:hypothetical protein
MRDLLDGRSGDRLLGKSYLDDFDRNFWNIGASGFWKLERRQTFQEPHSESWLAFARGGWDEALRLHEARRPSLVEYYARIAARGFTMRRVRVVRIPITPYLQWESHLLRMRHALGGRVRVVTPEQVAPWEASGPLPEITVLGDGVMYEVLYDLDGCQYGAVRYTDPDLIAQVRAVIVGLDLVGEDFGAVFDREIATLPPPCPR